jgi:hypothetical protein
MARWVIWLSDTSKIARFGWLAALCGEVVDTIDEFLTARTAYEADKNPEKRLRKDNAKKAAIDRMRNFANVSIRFNDKMTEEEKLYLGIQPTDTTHTAQPAPTSQPDTDVIPTKNNYEHLVRALNRDTGTLSKPDDAYGVRYAWQVGGEKPASGEDLPKTEFSRKSSYVVAHSEADKGKTAYYATCYENGRGYRGQWSPVIEAIIA